LNLEYLHTRIKISGSRKINYKMKDKPLKYFLPEISPYNPIEATCPTCKTVAKYYLDDKKGACKDVRMAKELGYSLSKIKDLKCE